MSTNISRRSVLKTSALTAGALALSGPAILFSVACGSTKDLVKWIGIVIDSLKQISPILSSMGLPNIVALVARAVPVAEKLKKAFQDNDQASVLTWLDALINTNDGLIVAIAQEIGKLNPGDPQTKIILGVLAIAQVALHLIVANIDREVPAAGVAAAQAANPTATASLQGAVVKQRLNSSLAKAFQATKF